MNSSRWRSLSCLIASRAFSLALKRSASCSRSFSMSSACCCISSACRRAANLQLIMEKKNFLPSLLMNLQIFYTFFASVAYAVHRLDRHSPSDIKKQKIEPKLIVTQNALNYQFLDFIFYVNFRIEYIHCCKSPST